MKLDCIEQTDGVWSIINYDNNKEFVSSVNVDDAWYLAAMKMEKMINKIENILKEEL